MSHIDELISDLFPEGAPYVSVTDVAEYVRGVTYSKHDEQDDGLTRVLRANNITLSSNTLNFEDVKRVSGSVRVRDNQQLRRGDILICAGSGSKAHIGKVAYISEDLQETFGGFMGVIRSKGHIEPRFLFHLLTGGAFAQYLGRALSTTTINNLNTGVVRGFRIPVPPLEVQREIVRILDQFTQLEAELEADLEAELETRRRQYEHYRHDLLSFDSGIQWSTLDDVADYVNGKAHERLADPDGDIPMVTARFISRNGEANRFVRLEDIQTRANKDDTALVLSDLPNGRALARTFFVDRDNGYAINQRVARLRVKDASQVAPRFLFHVLDRNPGLLLHDNGVDQTHLSKGQVTGLRFPLPPVEEQRRIVGILDKFDALVNDLSVGLPAERAARRKQYEYYRDKLLTFEEAAA